MSTEDTAGEDVGETTTWPELGIALYEQLTGRDATIEYQFEEMEVMVPSKAGPDATHAHWELDGSVSITTHEE
jgi:hypothetical protein